MQAGASDDKIRQVPTWRESRLFSPVERDALEYAERMTITGEKVDDELFARLRGHFSEAQMVELTAAVALENFRSKFNRRWASRPRASACCAERDAAGVSADGGSPPRAVPRRRSLAAARRRHRLPAAAGAVGGVRGGRPSHPAASPGLLRPPAVPRGAGELAALRRARGGGRHPHRRAAGLAATPGADFPGRALAPDTARCCRW